MLTSGTSMGGRYQLSERIATGGMGDVWKAEDTVLGRTIAVKVLQPAMLEEPGFAQRFRAEAQAMATINHPGVVQVYDYGESPMEGGKSVAFLVMEYVEGEPLNQVLNNVGRLTPARTMDLIAQAADALHAAHERGIVHRDVKPGNLLVRPDGKLVLTDFGIARSAITGNLTQVGSVLGTASYVSPEQASGNRSITPASDVYSLGVVAYQCLAGRRPFEGDSPVEVAMKHVNQEPPPLPTDVPNSVRVVVVRAMAKDVVARWPSAKAMAEAARAAAAGRPVSGGPGVAGTALLPGPGGTAVIPGGMAQTGPAGGVAPTSPARGGQYARGAAAVPFGVAQGEEEYQQTNAVQQANQSGASYQAAQARGETLSQGGHGGYSQQGTGYSQGGGGYSQGGAAGKSISGKSISGAAVSSKVLGAAAGVLALLLLGALLIFLTNQEDGDGGPETAGDTTTEATSAAAEMVEIKEGDYLRRPVDVVERELKAKQLNVVKEKGPAAGYGPGEVTEVSPVGRLEKWSTVTVYFQPERQAPRFTNPGGGHTPGGTEPSPDPTTSEPPRTPPPTTTEPTSEPTPTLTIGDRFTAKSADDSQKDFSG